MLDAVVQFARNFMCCIKDLQLFSDTFLYDPSVTAQYYKAPPPLDQTTPLEVIISFSQFYAFVSCTRAGFRLMTQTWRKLRRVNNLIGMQSIKPDTIADQIVNESLMKEQRAARRNCFVGFNVMCLGIAFFWLVGNSWHVTSTNWIGGLPFLVHALTVMEVVLIPLLCYMIWDGNELLAESDRMKAFAEELKELKGQLPKELINAESYSWLVHGGWTPFWASGVHLLQPEFDDVVEQKKLNDEVSKVKTTLDGLLARAREPSEKEEKILKQALNETAARLESDAPIVRMQAYREYFYFVVNFVAFYGYMLGILCYYFHDEEVQPQYVRSLKFQLANLDADWHGNFAGDFMWTIEPIVILTSPMLLVWMKPKMNKVKSD